MGWRVVIEWKIYGLRSRLEFLDCSDACYAIEREGALWWWAGLQNEFFVGVGLRVCIVVWFEDGFGCLEGFVRSSLGYDMVRSRDCVDSSEGLVRRRLADCMVLFGFPLGLRVGYVVWRFAHLFLAGL